MGARQNYFSASAVALIFVLTATLPGCTERLEHENAELKHKAELLQKEVDEHQAEYYRRQAEIQYWRKAAAQAAACDYIVSLCPPSWTTAGHTALQNGIDPDLDATSGNWWFWILVILKFIPGLLFLLAMGYVVTWLWQYVVLPSRAEVQKARAELEAAEQAASTRQDKELDLQQRLLRLIDQCHAEQNKIDRAQALRREHILKALRARESLRALRARRRALDAFR